MVQNEVKIIYMQRRMRDWRLKKVGGGVFANPAGADHEYESGC